VCYDVRFPELYRALAPWTSSSCPRRTANHRRAHWETLLRARAIENLAWVLAPAQGGTHANGRQTTGTAWWSIPGAGRRRTGGRRGVVMADIDPTFQAKMRRALPALAHRVL